MMPPRTAHSSSIDRDIPAASSVGVGMPVAVLKTFFFARKKRMAEWQAGDLGAM
jgi:hypothetical protein